MQFELMMHTQIYVVAKNLPGICRGLKFDYVDRTIQEVKKKDVRRYVYIIFRIEYAKPKKNRNTMKH